MLNDTEPSLLEQEEAENVVIVESGDAEPPRWWNRELAKVQGKLGALRKENARLRSIVDANECRHALETSGSWQVARRLDKQLRTVARERDALLVEIRPHRVRAFCEEHGLPANVVELIGDRDPGEWLDEFGATLTINEGDHQ